MNYIRFVVVVVERLDKVATGVKPVDDLEEYVFLLRWRVLEPVVGQEHSEEGDDDSW
jgi:hypothetical protein